jgi:hypothetical protein
MQSNEFVVLATFLALRTVPSGASVLGSTDLDDSTSVMRYATPDAAPAGSEIHNIRYKCSATAQGEQCTNQRCGQHQ